MGATATANKVIDRALLLKEGGVIALPCHSYNDMEAVRVQLYKVKQQLEKQSHPKARSLYISRKVGENKWTVFITKERGVPGAIIIEDGIARPFDGDPLVPTDETEEERMERLKAEDLTELSLATEDAFDEAASKIEEMQGLPAEPLAEPGKEDKS